MRVGIIGCGAIGQHLCELLPTLLPEAGVALVVARAQAHERLRARLGPAVRLDTSAAAFADARVDLVIECAGHAGLREHGAQVLEAGIDLLVLSVGALADAATESALRAAAEASGARIHIPAGAAGGLDVLSSARSAGLDRVLYHCAKAPLAWKGTPAESMLDLAHVAVPTVFFSGTVREAARLFPRNANFASAVALAGIGFDRTLVNLCADPGTTRNTHSVEASGPFGEISVRVSGAVLAANPKTSLLTPHSVVSALANLCRPLSPA
ncbi:MAG: aspartate dehydrogenase [Pseudomonadota bacterium]